MIAAPMTHFSLPGPPEEIRTYVFPILWLPSWGILSSRRFCLLMHLLPGE